MKKKPSILLNHLYAETLFFLAYENNFVKDIEKKFSEILILNKDKNFQFFIKNPTFSKKVKFLIINEIINKLKIFQNISGNLLGNFLKVLVLNGRLNILPEIIEIFFKISSQKQGNILIKVISCVQLNKDQEEKLKLLFSEYDTKNIILELKVDPYILGGLIIKIGSYQIDSSFRTRINFLKGLLKKG